MKFFTSYYKRLKIRNIKIAVLAVFVSIFFLPSFVPFEKMGNNMFTVILNSREVGVVSSPGEAEEYLIAARRKLAETSEELILVESELEMTGSEVLWGKVDAPHTVTDAMVQILAEDVKDTLHRSYVVKINEYMVNLSSKGDVVALLQAALDKYGAAGRYQAEVDLDPSRELSVLTTVIKSREDAVKEARETVKMEAGIHAELTEVFAEVEPAGEKDFEDYDSGIISMEYGDDVEVVEAYLREEDLTDLSTAVTEVTQDEGI